MSEDSAESVESAPQIPENTRRFEAYLCRTTGSMAWHLLVSDSGPDYLYTPSGTLHESPEGETDAWLNDEEWSCSKVNVKNTPFWEGTV